MFKLTSEQEEIVNTEVPFLAIKAFAGTGKTTTLVEFARKRPQKRFLYLAFNKSVADNAKNLFPRNVEISTAHSLAFRTIGKKYQHKLKRKLRVADIKDILALRSNREGNAISKIILELITSFCHSSFLSVRDAFDYSMVYPVAQDSLITYAETIWNLMVDIESDFPISHDVYLKLYQLTAPSLNKDYILFDEAQDANPAIVDIVYNQRDCGVNIVFVGDEHQAIYGFRGAKNTLRKIQPDKELYLTESFRFGKNIALAINAILKIGKNEKKDIIGFKEIDFFGEIDPTSPFAVITRTNSNLFLKACEVAEKKKKIYFVGGYDSYQFYRIKDVEHLYNERVNLIKDEHIKSFKGFSEMMDVSEQVDDKELIYLGKIVDRYKGKVSQILNLIKERTVVNINQADIILSTAHKAKGLEFEQVMLTNDYANIIDSDGGLLPLKMKEEELNILYVAASRAKMYLRPNLMLKRILKYYENNGASGASNNTISYKTFKSSKKTISSKIENKF